MLAAVPALVLVPARVARGAPLKPRNLFRRRTPRPASRRAARLRLLKTRRHENRDREGRGGSAVSEWPRPTPRVTATSGHSSCCPREVWAVHFECRGAPARACPGVEMRGLPPLAPSAMPRGFVCVQLYLTFQALAKKKQHTYPSACPGIRLSREGALSLGFALRRLHGVLWYICVQNK